MKNIVTRSLSGIVYIVLIVGCVLGGKLWFAALSVLFVLAAMIEFQKIVLPAVQTGVLAASRITDIAAAVCMVIVPAVWTVDNTVGIVIAAIAMAYPLIRFTIALYDRSEAPFTDVAWSMGALAYLAFPLMLLDMVYLYGSPSGRNLIMAMFVMIWLNDTGAYCVGSMFGRRKLFERLSPKKSWEGFFGGLLFCVIAAALCSLWLNMDNFSLAGWIGYGIIVCVFSTWGDLFESLLKRTHGIKDSGNLIPGHGGILDRIDSLLFVAPATFFYALFLEFVQW